MSEYQERMAAIQAGHDRMGTEYHRVLTEEGPPPPPEDQRPGENLSPGWQGWYDEFCAVKDQMYQLAYDLGIDFDPDQPALSEDYRDVWHRIQLALSEDGSRRRMTSKGL